MSFFDSCRFVLWFHYGRWVLVRVSRMKTQDMIIYRTRFYFIAFDNVTFSLVLNLVILFLLRILLRWLGSLVALPLTVLAWSHLRTV